MGRLMSIDYGRKRCGIAVTDTLRIVATGLDTVPTHKLTEYVTAYVKREPVDMIIGRKAPPQCRARPRNQ